MPGNSRLDEAFSDNPGRPASQALGPQEGRITRVTAQGAFFTMQDYDGGKHEFGPAPWSKVVTTSAGAEPHLHTAVAPGAGVRCLVVFVGAGVARPWVIGWWT